MKKLFFFSFLFLFVSFVWSEDLSEVAKREKARREALKKQGKKATVLTNEDVKNIKSSLGIESNTPVVEDESAAPEGSTGPIEPAAAVQEAIDQSKDGLEELKRQKAELTKEIQSTSDSMQQSGVHSSNIGQQYREKRLKEEELRKVEEKIEQLERQEKEPQGEPQQD
jgi:hypothetical protein